MVQRKGKNETVAQNGVSNGHINGKAGNKGIKAVKTKGLPMKEESHSDSEPSKQSNGHSSEKMEKRKRTPSGSQTLGERKAALSVRSTSESKGDSMAFLLTQGLMANDASKIDTVLEKTNPNVIHATLAELPTTEVIPLLKAIEIRLRTRKALDIRPWIRWAQCCLSFHLPYLSSQPSLESALGGLLDWMRNRTSHMQKLLALNGKMNVFVEEMEKRRGGAGRNWNVINKMPLVVFNEDEGKSEDEMDSMSGDDEDGASSEEDWWDDGGVAAAEGEEESEEEDEAAESAEDDNDDDSDEGAEGEEDSGEEDQDGDEGDSDEDMDV